MQNEEIADRLDYDRIGRQRTIITGNQSCSWKANAPERNLYLTIWDERDFFVDIYRTRLLPVFRPFEVDGLPAVEQQTSPEAVVCTTTVGLGNGRALDLQTSIDDGLDPPTINPCVEGRRVAAAIVEALPPA